MSETYDTGEVSVELLDDRRKRARRQVEEGPAVAHRLAVPARRLVLRCRGDVAPRLMPDRVLQQRPELVLWVGQDCVKGTRELSAFVQGGRASPCQDPGRRTGCVTAAMPTVQRGQEGQPTGSGKPAPFDHSRRRGRRQVVDLRRGGTISSRPAQAAAGEAAGARRRTQLEVLCDSHVCKSC